MRPPSAQRDKFGAEHDVYLCADGTKVLKLARNYGFMPAFHRGLLIYRDASPDEYLVEAAALR